MKIFVSSTYEDLKEHRTAVRDAILKLGHQPIMMEHMLATTNPPKRECLSKVEESDILLGIYAYRYGFIPKEDTISITEQEYRHALIRGKDVFCFIIDPSCDWPDRFKDENPQLHKFLDEVKRDHVVNFFKTPEELAIQIAAALAKVQEQRLGPWQQKARKIDNREKLKLINKLIGENNLGTLTDGALKSTTKLIASDFDAFNPATPLKLIEYTGKLLEGDIQIDQFVYTANELSGEIVARTIWLYKAKNKIRQMLLPAVIFLLIGLALGVLSYRENWWGVRSKYLAGKNANPMDVVNWLVEQARKNFIPNDTSAAGTKTALVALRLARGLDKERREINNFFDLLLENTRMATRDRNAELEVLERNIEILERYYNYVPYDSFRTEVASLKDRVSRIRYSNEAKAMLDDLQKQEKDSTVSNERLLQGYRTLLSNYPHFIKADSIALKITSFEKAAARFNREKQIQARDILTVSQKLDSLREFKSSQTRESPEKSYANTEINHLVKVIQTSASILRDEDFVTCVKVDTVTYKLQGVSDSFLPNRRVWVLASINVPSIDRVVFKWYAKGKLYDSTRVYTVNKSTSYHLYARKFYGDDSQGMNEVRLYNKQNLLIGRRVFSVGQ